jgi:hypothetical protein
MWKAILSIFKRQREVNSDYEQWKRESVSMAWVLREVYGLSEEDIKAVQKQRPDQEKSDLPTRPLNAPLLKRG